MSVEDKIVNKSVVLRFSPENVDQPLIYRLVKDYDLIPNIIKANINPDKLGYMVLTLSGYESDYRKGIEYMRQFGMEIQCLSEHIVWDRNVCTQCGSCTAVCPTHALSLNRPAMTVNFDENKCIVCRMCVQACPVKAVRVDF